QRLCRWDVFPQQVISYSRQNQGQGRSRSVLIDVAAQIWNDETTGKITAEHLQAWCDEGRLTDRRGKLHLGPLWQRFADHEESEYSIHSNIRSGGAGVAVRSNLTGEVIGHVSGPPEGVQTLTIAGRQHHVIRRDAEIVVTPVTDETADASDDTPQYGGRRRRISEIFAAHVRRGC